MAGCARCCGSWLGADPDAVSPWRFLTPTLTAAITADVPAAATFSVVIPVYQGAHLIAEAIESVLAQTEQPLETIVVDDGSTDALAAALRPFAGRVRLLELPHGGLSRARNAGMAAASAHYAVFLDADDVLEPRFLEALRALWRHRPDLDILTSDCLFEKEGRVTGRFYEHNEFAVDDQRTAILRSCFLHTKTAVRRDRYLSVGGCDPVVEPAEDWDLWSRLILTGSHVGLVDAPLSRYRLHGDQMTARRATSLASRLAVAQRLVSRPDLTASERAAVAETIPPLCARVTVAAAEEPDGARLARRAWLAVARNGRLPRRARLRGVVGLLSPRVAARGGARRRP
jgi:hypothetical protein